MILEECQWLLIIVDLMIDIGVILKEEVIEMYKIDFGVLVILDVMCCYNEQIDFFLGKVFDCCIGCVCLVDVMEELKEEIFLFKLVVIVIV